MEDIKTKQDYQNYVDKKTPNSPILKNCFNAFWVGGLICAIGQLLFYYFKSLGLSETLSISAESIVLIFIAILLSAFNLFNKIGKLAGAGSLVPITGFANAIVSPAIEYKSDGHVLGIGAKMFIIAGPVLVYGISTSVIIGLLHLLFM